MTNDRAEWAASRSAVLATVERYFTAFPEARHACMTDAVSNAGQSMLERALTQADIAMQDEGLDETARQRVISAALFGSVDEAAAIKRQRKTAEQLEKVQQGVEWTPDWWRTITSGGGVP